MGEQRRLSPRHHPIPASPYSAQTVLSKSKSKDTKSKMKLSSALGFALVLAIILVILTPEAKSIRPHRGALASRAMGMGGGRGIRAKMANRRSSSAIRECVLKGSIRVGDHKRDLAHLDQFHLATTFIDTLT